MEYNITYREKDKGIQFIISYKDTDGKWKQKSKQGFSGKKEAKAAAELALEDLKKNLSRRAEVDSEFLDMPFIKFAEFYLEHERLYREENTIEITMFALKKFEALNKLELEKITNLNIQKCVDKMVKEGLSRQTIINYLSRIKVIFNAAKNVYKIIKENPAQNIKLPVAKEKKEKTALTVAQFEDLLSKIDNPKYYLITLLAGSCGLRIGEILGLRLCDIDKANLVLNVRQQLKRKSYNKHGEGKLKSRNSYRTVPLSPTVLSAIMNYKADNPLNFSGRIFSNISTSNMSSALSDLYSKLGYGISVHELRHTFGTFLVSRRHDFKTVAKIMGTL